MHDLIQTWSSWKPEDPPYILKSDYFVLSTEKSKRAIDPSHTSWNELINEPDFGVLNMNLQLGLLPLPFCGDLQNAQIYILMLNPGFGVHDYYAELEVPTYREATLDNLRQDFSDNPYPFYFLDPQFAWSGGYKWWHNKLYRSIRSYAESKGIDHTTARRRFSQSIASIEMIPYHSTNFKDVDHWVRDLRSAQLARQFVTEYVLPKAYAGEATVIVTRQVKAWDLPDHPNIIKYTAGESQGAHLTPDSPGGAAILRQLYILN